VEKYCGAGQATDVNMAHAHCMLDNRLCNTHCLSTATIFARTRLNVTLYVLYIACIAALCCHGFVKQGCENESLELQSPVGLV
jgi:hypothetical protein